MPSPFRGEHDQFRQTVRKFAEKELAPFAEDVCIPQRFRGDERRGSRFNSIGFQLATLLHQIIRLQENEQGAETSPERQFALDALNAVRSLNIEEVARRDAGGNFSALEKLVCDLKATLWDLSDGLTARYFSNMTACRFTASS